MNYLTREYLVWFLKVAGVDTGNIFRWRTMAASFPIVTVLISPIVDTGNIFRNIFRWRTMAASFPIVSVLISPE